MLKGQLGKGREPVGGGWCLAQRAWSAVWCKRIPMLWVKLPYRPRHRPVAVCLSRCIDDIQLTIARGSPKDQLLRGWLIIP
jgi:hypothetical protein